MPRNIVPRIHEEGQIGRFDKHWLKGWYKDMFVSQYLTDGTNTVTIAELISVLAGLQSYLGESLVVSSTTSTTPIEKLKLNLTSIDAGDYFVVWSCLVSASVKNVLMAVDVNVDDTYQRATGCTELAGNKKYSDGIRIPYSGHFIETFTSGSHFIDMDFYSGTVGKTVYILNARLFALKVGD